VNEDLRFPVGRAQRVEQLSAEDRDAAIRVLETAPDAFREAVRGLSDDQLDTHYRDGGWTVRQVLHHLADSHVNADLRTRLALTEDTPMVRAYDEGAFAELADARGAPVELALLTLEGVHGRWTRLLRALDEQDFARRYQHPDGRPGTVDTLVSIYAWHSRHHTAHVTALRARKGW